MNSLRVRRLLTEISQLSDLEKQEFLKSLDLGEISLEHLTESVKIYGNNMQMGGADTGRCPKCGK